MENKTLKQKKKEILAMSEKELIREKYKEKTKESSNCFDCSYCSYCSNCSNCYNCYNCSDCSNCSNCSNCSDCSYSIFQKNKKYIIANVQFTKKEYEEWKIKH